MESPRGRIYLAKALDAGELSWTLENQKPFDSCIGCRACETACPSDVKYGHILQEVRETFDRKVPRLKRKLLVSSASNSNLLRLGRAVAPLIGIKAPQVKKNALFEMADSLESIPIQGEVAIFRGCAMPVFFQNVNLATERLLRRIGFKVKWIESCCGALLAHDGEMQKARNLVNLAPAGLTIISNSAGCGSWQLESGLNVQDISTFLVENGLIAHLSCLSTTAKKIVYQDACHHLNGIKVGSATRDLLRAIPGIEILEIEESQICCGSGGLYQALEPERATKLVQRKWKNILAMKPEMVISSNPGCLLWLEQNRPGDSDQLPVFHILVVLEALLSGVEW